MVQDVTSAYDSLPANERAQACVFTENYGEASALILLAKSGSLPPVISGHNTYWLWGPGSCSGQVVITVGLSQSDVAQSYLSVTSAGTVQCSYCQPDEYNAPIYIATQPRAHATLSSVWQRVKHFN
jgi:hypothetical protein